MWGKRKKDNQSYPKVPPKKKVTNVVGSAKPETGKVKTGFFKRKEKIENVCPICRGHCTLPYGHKCWHCKGNGICHCKTHPSVGDFSPYSKSQEIKNLTIEQVKERQNGKHQFLARKKSDVSAGNLVNYIIEYENGEISSEDYLKLFSYLIKSGQAWQLQGSVYGRPARMLIDKEVIAPDGKILKTVEQLEMESKFEQS